MSQSAKLKGVLRVQELKCKNGCGYYGNPEWQGCCSKCYKELYNRVGVLGGIKGSSKKVTRSYSDAQESSSLSLGFTKFEEKKKQQSEKRSKTIKSIIKRGQTSKGPMIFEVYREVFSTADMLEVRKQLPLKDAGCQDIVYQINYQLEIMRRHYDKSIDEQSEVAQDFYNFLTNRFETHHYYQDLSAEQVDQLLDIIEDRIMEFTYNTVFNQISSEYEEKDLALQNRIRSLNWITAERLGLDIKENSPQIRELIDKAITDVIEMNSKVAPQSKISCIVNCSKNILNIINLSQGVTVSADEFLPAMVYVVLKANPPLLHSNVKYVTSYSIPARLRSGEGAYYFTNMCCAVEFIEHLTSESLNLTEDEFNRYLAGEVPGDYTEQSITSCEGIRSMTQNLATLNELHEKRLKMLDEMEKLKGDLTISEDLIKKLKSTLPFNISPTPYKVPANIDMSLVPEIFRSRVVKEESNEILVDIDCKIENGSNAINLNSGCSIGNVLEDFQDMSVTESQAVDPSVNISNLTVIQPLQVAFPEPNSSCDYTSSSSSFPIQSTVSQPVLNIKDLEYPTEIFPDKSDENPYNSVGEEKTLSDVIDAEETCLIGSLPPPLQPVIVQSGKSESDN